VSAKNYPPLTFFSPVNQLTATEAKEGTAKDISRRAKALFQFASLAVLTQAALLLNQLVLLPIQVRIWGTDLFAYWSSVVALACFTGVADLGLRTAGHATLMRFVNDPTDVEARRNFAHLWAWIRILVASITILLIGADFLFQHVWLGQDYPLWRAVLVLGITCEVILGVRITYLDTQGYYRESEAGYLVMLVARLILSFGALLIFHAPPYALAWIWLAIGILSVVQQSLLCRRIGLLHLFEPLPPGMSIRYLAAVRYSMADPCATWMRTQMPVVILSSIAQPVVVVAYVALRAVFGLARQTISQLSRFASVEYLSLRQAGKQELAEIHLTAMMLAAAFMASSVTAFVLVDNCRLASLWIKQLDPDAYRLVAVMFGLGNTFFTFQITQAVSRRSGEVAGVAGRQYFYMLCAGVFAVIALIAHSLLVWLVLLLVADILQALSFMLVRKRGSILSQTSAGRRASLAGAISSALVLGMVLLMHFGKFEFLEGKTVDDVLCTIAFFLTWILLIGLADLSLFLGLRFKNMSLHGAVFEWVQRVRHAKLQNE
jgi:hypothetical protein